jgi:hypothetical protein
MTKKKNVKEKRKTHLLSLAPLAPAPICCCCCWPAVPAPAPPPEKDPAPACGHRGPRMIFPRPRFGSPDFSISLSPLSIWSCSRAETQPPIPTSSLYSYNRSRTKNRARLRCKRPRWFSVLLHEPSWPLPQGLSGRNSHTFGRANPFSSLAVLSCLPTRDGSSMTIHMSGGGTFASVFARLSSTWAWSARSYVGVTTMTVRSLAPGSR